MGQGFSGADGEGGVALHVGHDDAHLSPDSARSKMSSELVQIPHYPQELLHSGSYFDDIFSESLVSFVVEARSGTSVN